MKAQKYFLIKGYRGKEWKKEKEEEHQYMLSPPMDLQQYLIVPFGQSDDQTS